MLRYTRFNDNQKDDIVRYIEAYISSGGTVVEAVRKYIMEHPEYHTSSAAINGIYYQHRKIMKEKQRPEMWTEDEDMKFEEMMKAAPAEEKREENFERIGKELGRAPTNVKFHFYSKQSPKTPPDTSKVVSRIFGLVEDNIAVVDIISRISSLDDDDFIVLKAQVDAMYLMRARKGNT